MKSFQSQSNKRAQPEPGKTDLLLRLFESSFFNEWIAIQYLFQCKPGEAIERYLLQLVYLAISKPGQALEYTIIGMCSRSFKLAVKVSPFGDQQLHQLSMELSPQAPPNGVLSVHQCPDPATRPNHQTQPLASSHQTQPPATRPNHQTQPPSSCHQTQPPAPGPSHQPAASRHSNQTQPSDPATSAPLSMTMVASSSPPHRTSSFCPSRAVQKVNGGIPRSASALSLSNCLVLPERRSLRTPGKSSPADSNTPSFSQLPMVSFPIPIDTQRLEHALDTGNNTDLHGMDVLSPHLEERIKTMREMLGEGEGVTALLEKSKTPGVGVVVVSEGGVVATHSKMLNIGDEEKSPGTCSRQQTYTATLDFIDKLCEASSSLTRFPQDERQRALRSGLDSINRDIDDASRRNVAIWFPMGKKSDRVIRLATQEAVLLTSREKAPFMLFVEVLEGDESSEEKGPQASPSGKADATTSAASGRGPWSISSLSVNDADAADEGQAELLETIKEMVASPTGGRPPSTSGNEASGAKGARTSPGRSSIPDCMGIVFASNSAQETSTSSELPQRSMSRSSSVNSREPTHKVATPTPGVSQALSDQGTLTVSDMAELVHSGCLSPPLGSAPSAVMHQLQHALASLRGNQPLVRLHLRVLDQANCTSTSATSLAMLSDHAYCASTSAAALVSVRFEVAAGVNLAIPSPARKSRRTPSIEALSLIASQYKIKEIPPAVQPHNGSEAYSGSEGSRNTIAGCESDYGSDIDCENRDAFDGATAGHMGHSWNGLGPGEAGNLDGVPAATPTQMRKEGEGQATPTSTSTHPPAASTSTSEPNSRIATLDLSGVARSARQARMAHPPHAHAHAQQAIDRPRREANAVFGERWAHKVKRIQKESPDGQRKGWALRCVIVKNGDDCRQEHLALQLIRAFQDIFRETGLPLTALIEMVPDALSIHTIKNRSQPGMSLSDHFFARFVRACTSGQPNPHSLSVASTSIIRTFHSQIKDRHNGNILLDEEGHIIHIDFGFFLSNSPGGNLNFESAPFKLTRELLEIMDSNSEGKPSELFWLLKCLVTKAFSSMPQAPRKYPVQSVQMVLTLISDSLDAWRTRQYDYYQRV
eukprot:gene25834-11512_t